jgi:hypothetical protein
MVPSPNLVIQCERVCEQSLFTWFAIIGSVAAIWKKINAGCRYPPQEFIACLFDPFGITSKIENSVISARVNRPTSQRDSVMFHDKIGVPRIDSRFLRKVQKVALPKVHPCANAEVCDHDKTYKSHNHF